MTERKPGRPRAIPESVIPDLLRLYDRGLGYRGVARELSKQGVSADWSTVRRIIKSRRSVDSGRNAL
jgi:transposase-like protein